MISELISTWGQGNCTAWWDSLCGLPIGDLCYDHDAAYDTGVAWYKLRGDWRLVRDIWQRAGSCDSFGQTAAVRALDIAMGLAVSTFGWIFWFKAKM